MKQIFFSMIIFKRMVKRIAVIFFFFLLACNVYRNEKKETEKPSGYEQIKTFGDIDSKEKTNLLYEWVKARKEDKRLVQLPLVVRSGGWGCDCPETYIGVHTNYNEGFPWLKIITKADFPKMNEKGHSLIAKGNFTGNILEEKSNPDEETYTLYEFEVISWEENTKGEDVNKPMIVSSK